MICPLPLNNGSLDISDDIILNFVFRIGSAHNGPSRHAQLKPCMILSLMVFNAYASFSLGNVKSINMFVDVSNDHNDFVVNLSQ